ncbi:unnamed protein product [Amoebophrya sp. A25]|nr:unnamed protein product [Amoebophrya sp. A25]|eukprot:GSA25T00015843001.1
MFLSPARLRKDDITAIKEGIQEYVEQAAAASQGTPPSGDFDLSCHLRTRRSGRPDSQGRRYLGCKIAKFWLEIREGFGSNKLSQSGDTSEISDVTATRGGISYTTTFAWDHKRRNVADSVVSVWKQKPRSHEPEFLVAFGLRFERTWMCFYQVDAPTGQTDL